MNAVELYQEIVMAESEGNEKRALKLIDQMLKDYPYVKEAELAKDVRFRINYKNAGAGVKKKSNTSSKTDYGAARTILGLMSFWGWVLVTLGGLAVLSGIVISLDSSYNSPGIVVGMPLTIAGVFGAISGIFMVANVQLTRSSIDHADHSREILELLRKKL